MIPYSKSSRYAIHSVIVIASLPDNQPCRIEALAERENIPRPYLAKVMQRLVKRKIVRSHRGARGGFTMNRSPAQVNLFMIVDAIEDLGDAPLVCILGNQECSDTSGCTIHKSWKKLRLQQIEFLKSITIADLVRSSK